MIGKAVVPPGKSQRLLRDAVVPGLVVRILPGGARSFYFIYRPAGAGRAATQRWLKLGVFPALPLLDARAAGRIYAGLVAKGEDPVKGRAEAKRKSRSTLAVLLAEGGPYEAHLVARGLVNRKPALSSLRRGLRPHMAVDVAVLSRNDIVTSIDALTQAGKRGAAADLRKFTHGLLEWAVARGLAAHNVMAGLRVAGRTRAQRLRDAEQRGRALADDEIVKVWRAAEALQHRAMRGDAVSGALGGLVMLALLTGLRRGELAQLDHERHVLTGKRMFADHGVDGARIHLPPSVTKTGSSHDVPLTVLMRTVIEAQPRTLSPLVFPSRVGGPIRGWSRLLPPLRRACGVDFVLHDLRRTVRTLMSRLGIPEDIAELAIGHQRADLVARYNKDAAWAARTEAFETVSRHIAALLAADAGSSSNVIALHG
jgi:integrase